MCMVKLTFYYTHNTMWYQCNSAILYRLNWIVHVSERAFFHVPESNRTQSCRSTTRSERAVWAARRDECLWANTAFGRCDWCSLSTVCSARMVANRSVFVVHGIRFLESFLDMIQLLYCSSHAQHKDTHRLHLFGVNTPITVPFTINTHAHARAHSTVPWNILMKFQLTTAENMNYDKA